VRLYTKVYNNCEPVMLSLGHGLRPQNVGLGLGLEGCGLGLVCCGLGLEALTTS